MKRFLTILLCLLLAAGAVQADSPAAGAARTAEEVAALRQAILADEWQRAGVSDLAAWLSGPLAEAAGTTAEWYVLALSGAEGGDFGAYQAKLRAYLDSHTIRSATTRQKYAMALLATGVPADDPFLTATLADSLGKQGLMSWVWGLHLMNNGVAGEVPAEEVVSRLLSAQFADGGWALNGTVSDVDVTAMTLQALAPHASRADVAAAVERALSLLAERQLPDGGFVSYGVANPESPAQVLAALAALGIDGLADARFIKDGATLLDGMKVYLLPEGGFCHQSGGPRNHSATVQTFLALTAWQRLQRGQGSLYLFDMPENTPDPETTPGTALAEWGYQPIAALVLAGAALLVCALLFLMGKRHWKNFLAVAVLAALGILFVLTTDFQSADEYYSVAAVRTGEPIGAVTLSIRCDTVAGREDYIPADGVILPETAFPIAEGDTVYSVLTAAVRAHRIHLENSGAPGMAYIAGMAYLYEQGFGDLSGWLYSVNGERCSQGCDQVSVRDGDVIRWDYTLQMGEDLP